MAVAEIKPYGGIGAGSGFDRQAGQTGQTGTGRHDAGGGEGMQGVPTAPRVRGAEGATERDTGNTANYSMERKDLLPLAVKIRKDPTMAVETLKQLINSDLLQVAKSGGYTELYEELESLTAKIYLSKDDLMNEITAQEKETTMFSGHKLFDLLRRAVQPGGTGLPSGMSEEGRTAVGNFLKAVNFSLNKDEILMALTSNLSFLSNYFAPSKELSGVLSDLADRWEQLLEFSKTGVPPDSADFADSENNPNLQNRELPFYMRNLTDKNSQNTAPALYGKNAGGQNFGKQIDALNAFKNMLDTVRDDTADIMKIITGSLLASEKTHVLAPLIVHNMSRFNTNSFLLRDAFSALLQYIPNSSLRSEIVAAFDDYVNKVISPKQGGLAGGDSTVRDKERAGNNGVPSKNQNGVTGGIAQKLGALDTAHTAAAENAGKNLPVKADSLAGLLTEKLSRLYSGELLSPTAPQTQTQQEQQTLMTVDPKTGLPLPPQTQAQQPQTDPKTGLPVPVNPQNADIPQTAEDGTKAWVNHAPSRDIKGGGNPLPQNPARAVTAEESRAFFGSLTENTIGRTYQDYLMGGISGKEAVALLMQRIVQEPSKFAVIRGELDKIDSIAKLSNYILEMTSLMPETPVRAKLEEVFEGLLSDMAWRTEHAAEKGVPLKEGELPLRSPVKNTEDNPQETAARETARTHEEINLAVNSGASKRSSLGELTDFIQKNISHSALRTINSFNASNLLQSLINAPGVFTPLAHLIVPLQYEDTRAFGELWVDNDSAGKGGTAGSAKRYHIFLTFDIETIGRFEIDMYSVNEDVSLAVLYPEGYGDGGGSGGKRVEKLRSRIDAFISRAGYKTREIQAGVLREPHSLSQIFPRINENRRGFETVV